MEEYRMFFNRLNLVEHNSCCLTILTEKVLNLDTSYQQLEIQGLDWRSCQMIFENSGLKGTPIEWEILVKKYHGNIQYLRLIVPTIQNIFNGSIWDFLDNDILVYDRIETYLDDFMSNLSAQEKYVIACLVNHPQGMKLDLLKDIFAEKIEFRELVKTIDKLTRKSLIELKIDRFVLTELVAEYSIGRSISGSEIDRHNN
jgi:hypothetical protein